MAQNKLVAFRFNEGEFHQLEAWKNHYSVGDRDTLDTPQVVINTGKDENGLYHT